MSFTSQTQQILLVIDSLPVQRGTNFIFNTNPREEVVKNSVITSHCLYVSLLAITNRTQKIIKDKKTTQVKI
jgi:hypothetical protein